MTVQSKNGKTPEAGVAEKVADTSAVTVNEKGQLNGNSHEASTPLTVEDKIKKINSLQELIRVRGIMKTHLEKVEALKFGDFEEKDIITITSGNGQSYVIKSPLLCHNFKTMAVTEISAYVAEIETQINF